MYGLSQTLSGTVVYTIEQRGVGRSSRLGCEGPQAETPGSEDGVLISNSEFPRCASWLRSISDARYLRQYSTTQAARDLDAVLTYMKSVHGYAVVYGHSYGSYLVNRYV